MELEPVNRLNAAIQLFNQTTELKAIPTKNWSTILINLSSKLIRMRCRGHSVILHKFIPFEKPSTTPGIQQIPGVCKQSIQFNNKMRTKAFETVAAADTQSITIFISNCIHIAFLLISAGMKPV